MSLQPPPSETDRPSCLHRPSSSLNSLSSSVGPPVQLSMARSSSNDSTTSADSRLSNPRSPLASTSSIPAAPPLPLNSPTSDTATSFATSNASYFPSDPLAVPTSPQRDDPAFRHHVLVLLDRRARIKAAAKHASSSAAKAKEALEALERAQAELAQSVRTLADTTGSSDLASAWADDVHYRRRCELERSSLSQFISEPLRKFLEAIKDGELKRGTKKQWEVRGILLWIASCPTMTLI